MKYLFFCILLFSAFTSFAQNSSISIQIDHAESGKATLLFYNRRLLTDHLKKAKVELNLTQNHPLIYSLNLDRPQFVNLSCDSVDNSEGRSLAYTLFISPGDHLIFYADFKRKNFGFIVKGKGAENNQPLLGALPRFDSQNFYGDTTPARILPALSKNEQAQKDTLSKYVRLYHPTPVFVKSVRNNLRYIPLLNYYAFKEGNKFRIKDAYKRNFYKWQQPSDSLFSRIQLNNPEALNSYNYQELISTFLFRKKETLWRESQEDPEKFYKDWYQTDQVRGKALFNDDQTNLLQEKIINKYFNGDVAEYLYAVLFDIAFNDSNYKNLSAIFSRFKSNFPRSRYIPWFGALMRDIITKEQYKPAKDVVFLADNGSKFDTFQELLMVLKGKTVLLDMWGTWCGPCRSEFEKNNQQIKKHFFGKNIQFMYVANWDQKNKKRWKELIAFYKLSGTHILASESLTKSIMTSVNGKDYPTYVIIHKDGRFEISEAGYPMNREKLIGQLERALRDR